MYRTALATVSAILLFSGLARADNPVPPLSGDASNYCIYGNLIYSIGSTICNHGQGLVCLPADVPAGLATGNRGHWASTTEGSTGWPSAPTADQCRAGNTMPDDDDDNN
jgi:hypothetical protein